MPNNSRERQLEKLQAENKRLAAANEALRSQVDSEPLPRQKTPRGSFFKKIGVMVCIALAAALLIAGNLLFWAGNTLVKTDRYVEATAPLIKNAEIQNALASKINTAIFANVNIEDVTTDVLPPRADFLAPTIADQLQTHTESTIKKILQRPQFQERWNTAQEHAHDRFITAIDKHGSDAAIDISEVYSGVSEQLKGTKLGFLANKPLPAKVGNIQIISGPWIGWTQRVIQHIDTWRTIAIILMVLFSVLGVWLSRNRRKTVIILGSFFALGMFFTALSVRLAREVIAGKAQPQYAEAVRQAYSIIMHPLAVQTFTIMTAAILVVLIAWLSGPYKSARVVRLKIEQLFSGRLHGALFNHENAFTLWLGRYKAMLQWAVVAIVGLATLFVRLTPKALLTQFIIIVVLVLLVEILAASKQAVRLVDTPAR